MGQFGQFDKSIRRMARQSLSVPRPCCNRDNSDEAEGRHDLREARRDEAEGRRDEAEGLRDLGLGFGPPWREFA